MTPPAFYIGLELQTPDHDSARVILCGGDWVTVWLTNSHRPLEQRYKSYLKSAKWYDRYGSTFVPLVPVLESATI